MEAMTIFGAFWRFLKRCFGRKFEQRRQNWKQWDIIVQHSEATWNIILEVGAAEKKKEKHIRLMVHFGTFWNDVLDVSNV